MVRRASNPERIPQLNEALRWLRESQRLTQEDVAELAGISKVYYGQIERADASKYPSVEVLAAISGALSVDEQRIRELAELKPWDTTIMSRTLKKSKSTLRMHPDKYAPSRHSLAASNDLFDQVSQEAITMFSEGEESAVAASTYYAGIPSPTDEEDAEVLSIFNQLDRNDQLTVLGMLRSLARKQ